MLRQLASTGQLPCHRYPELFFAEQPQDVRDAKALCQTCPVRPACLAGALQRGEPWGVWGGELLLRGMVIPDKAPARAPTQGRRSRLRPADIAPADIAARGRRCPRTSAPADIAARERRRPEPGLPGHGRLGAGSIWRGITGGLLRLLHSLG